jgi:hypothetical protein
MLCVDGKTDEGAHSVMLEESGESGDESENSSMDVERSQNE